MSLAGGETADETETEAPEEFGRCGTCGMYVRGQFLEDLTAHTALVEHADCPAEDEPQ